MSKSPRADRPGTGKLPGRQGKKRSAGLVFLALLLVLLGAAYLAFQETGQKAGPGGPPSGSGGDADFNPRCDALHMVVDKVLAGQNLVVSDLRQDAKEAARLKNSGKIRWNARSLLVESTDGGSPDSIRRSLELALKSAGGVVVKTEADQYHGYSVTRIDVGISDRLGGEPLTIISDRIYLAEKASRPVSPGARQKTSTASKGEIALIIDDFGFRQDMVAEFSAIRRSFTFAVIPFKPYSADAAAKGLASGHQVMLHLPMEPMAGIDSADAAATVRAGMTAAQVRELIDRSTGSLTGIIGVNNHQGSRATADRALMEPVMKELKQKGLFFVDSRTSGRSVAAETARRENVKTTENDLFIDGIADADYVKKQLRTAGDMALRLGSVTVIGHARPTTAAALREMIPELEAKGIRFVFVSQVVR